MKSLAPGLAVAFALVSTVGCGAGAGDDAVTSSSAEALEWGGGAALLPIARDDGPTPLDHPEPGPLDALRAPSSRPFDVFREPGEWEPNPTSAGCFLRYVVLQDPRGGKVEVPMTQCY